MKIITVVSPKGGVGKTTIAANLALSERAKAGERVRLSRFVFRLLARAA